MEEQRSKGTGGQLFGSLVAAGVIVCLAVWAVTARLGPGGIEGREAADERVEAAEEQAEEAEEARQNQADEARRGDRRKKGKG